MPRTIEEQEGLSLLGNKNTEIPDSYNPDVLETQALVKQVYY